MLNHGPVDVIVLASGEPRFDGKILAELQRQAAAGTIPFDTLSAGRDNEE